MYKLTLHTNQDADYAQKIAAGTDASFELIPGATAEDTVFRAEQKEELETILWRYVTPADAADRGDYVDATTASDDDRQDFDHFSHWLEQEPEKPVSV